MTKKLVSKLWEYILNPLSFLRKRNEFRLPVLWVEPILTHQSLRAVSNKSSCASLQYTHCRHRCYTRDKYVLHPSYTGGQPHLTLTDHRNG